MPVGAAAHVIALRHDRRHSPRLPVNLCAERRIGHERINARIGDISAGGLMLVGVEALALGSVLELVLRSPADLVEVTVQGEVVRASAAGDCRSLSAGMRFVDVDRDVRSRLEQLLIELLPSPDHRRIGRRFDLHVPAVWTSASGSRRLAVRLMNASCDGARLDGIELPEPGARGFLRLAFSGRHGVEEVALPATGVWTDAARCSAGIAFDLNSSTWPLATRAISALLVEPHAPASDLGVERERCVAGCRVGEVMHRSERCTVFRGSSKRVLKRVEGPPAVVDAASKRFLRAMAVAGAMPGRTVRYLTSHTDADACWLAMERVEGRPLHELLAAFSRSGQPVPVRGLLSIVGEVLATLIEGAETFGRDFSHPSLDASCIWVCDDGSVKLGGFDAPFARRSDVRAIGELLYTALGGCSPEASGAPLSTLNPVVTRAVALAVSTALEPFTFVGTQAIRDLLDDCPVLGPQTATKDDRLLFLDAARLAERG